MTNEAALQEHCFYCFETIHAELHGVQLSPPPFDASPEFPLFVTWNIKSRTDGEYRLRGCIGQFEAGPLGDRLREYAAISAFRDHRFDPVTAKELARLECGVSLLTDFERCFDWQDWELGTHGIYVEVINPALNLSASHIPSPEPPVVNGSGVQESYRSLSALPKLKVNVPSSANPRRLPTVLHATFLPEVAPAQGWSKQEAVDAAIRKAGFKGVVTDEMRQQARVSRYQSKKAKADYNEWQDWRRGQGRG
ncbi:hypothetical protein JCM10213_004910 [Rhodosporidiobolus nylandii]